MVRCEVVSAQLPQPPSQSGSPSVPYAGLCVASMLHFLFQNNHCSYTHTVRKPRRPASATLATPASKRHLRLSLRCRWQSRPCFQLASMHSANRGQPASRRVWAFPLSLSLHSKQQRRLSPLFSPFFFLLFFLLLLLCLLLLFLLLFLSSFPSSFPSSSPSSPPPSSSRSSRSFFYNTAIAVIKHVVSYITQTASIVAVLHTAQQFRLSHSGGFEKSQSILSLAQHLVPWTLLRKSRASKSRTRSELVAPATFCAVLFSADHRSHFWDRARTAWPNSSSSEISCALCSKSIHARPKSAHARLDRA